MRVPDPKANTTTEAYLAYKAGYLEESELKPKLYEPDLHFDGWLAYWAGLTITYPNKGAGSKNLAYTGWAQDFVARIGTTVDAKLETVDGRSCVWWKANAGYGSYDTKYIFKTDFKENTQYTVSFDVKPSETFSNICFEYTDGTSVPFGSGLTPGEWQHVSSTSTAGKTLKNLHAFYYSGSAYVDINTFMVEEGSTPSSYEPYYAIPEMLCDEEALVAYLSGVTDTYPEEIKDPYDVRIVGYLKYLVSARFGRPEYPVNNEEFYLSTMDAPHTSNETPSADIELDTSAGKIISVEAYGDTYQQTYSGKNLFNNNATVVTSSSGTTASPLTTGVRITQSVSTTDSGYTWVLYIIGDTSDYVGKTLTLYAKATASSTNKPRMLIGLCNANGSGSTGNVLGDDFPGTVSRPITQSDADTRDKVCVAFYASAGSASPANAYVDYTDVQLEVGSATSYEPYVGGIPSPNPDYPQDIQVVTGEQTVELHGKNLFNPVAMANAWYTLESDGAISIGSAYTVEGRRYFNSIALKAGTYTLSFIPTTEAPQGLRYSIRDMDTTTDIVNENRNFVNGERQAYTFTLTQDYQNIGICLVMARRTEDGQRMYLYDIQLEPGSATTYQPYQSQTYTIDLGSTELCKIGNYQDYIYKSGDDWYVHKETGKVVFDGTENWADYPTQYTGYYTAYETTKGRWGDGVNFANVNSFKSDYFQNNGGDLGVDFQFLSSTGYATYLKINSSTASTSAELKTWLSAHITTVYYTLSTLTDTKVTDSTLIGQLNALAGADTYNEKTFIKVTANDPNLPALLKVEAYKY